MVNGIVHDEQNEPLAFASVSLFSATNNQFIKGGMTEENGSFKLEGISAGHYQIKITMIGYLPYEKQIHLVQENLDLHTIILAPDATALGEVTVTAKKDVIERKMDRLIMNVNDNAAFAGKTSFDLFRMAPGVFVNNGSISINGVAGTRIMVNGKPLNLSGDELKEYLQNLKADEVASLEVMAHPPAEYDAEGAGGIINIVLKKNAQEGMNGYVSADYIQGLGKYPAYRPSAKLNYKKDKLGMSLGYTYSRAKDFQDLEQERGYPNDGEYFSTNSSVSRARGHNIRFSSTYEISDKQYLGIDYNGQFGKYSGLNHSLANIFYPDASDNVRSVGTFPNQSSLSHSNVGINYSLTTDTLGSKLTILSDYTYRDRVANSGSISENFDAAGNLLSDTSFNFFFPSISKIFTVGANYNKKFNSTLELTFGGKMTATDIGTKNSYDIFLDDETLYGANAFDYNYREHIAAGFINLNGRFLQTDFKVGLRGENSNIDGALLGDQQDTTIKRNYFNLFPTVFLQRHLDTAENHTLNLSYNKRITRPSYSQLNPFEYYIDNYSMEVGNPLLNPQFTNAYEIGYLYKKRYYVSFGYNRTKDVINQVIESDSTQSLARILRKNTGLEQVYTITLSAPVSIAKWWSTSNTLLLNHTKSQAPEFDLSQSSFLFQSSHEISLPYSFSMNLNAFYAPRILQGNILIRDLASVDIGIQRKILQNKWLVKAAVSDVFFTHKIKASSYFNGSELRLKQTDQTRLLTLSLTYNFDVGKAFSLKELEKSNTEEKSRL